MKKPFIVANVREVLDLYDKEEISFSRMVEMLNEIAIGFSNIRLKSIWDFANGQREMLKQKHQESKNPLETMSLAFTINCIVDIMDTITDIIEPTKTK